MDSRHTHSNHKRRRNSVVAFCVFLTVKSFPIFPGASSTFINTNLLGLRQNRLGYVVNSGEEVEAIVVPATAEDGFNGYVDLLVAVDMTEYILAARVVRDLQTEQLHGNVDVIASQWMKQFDGNAMRDIRRISRHGVFLFHGHRIGLGLS